ncbi:hypothetical protein DSO57_1013318 [Entomophthora muscae]|uniref:Uncharacterized protein n=1 Tax=Entomophthora muscae TaxID=34485 RepID=A0ACC2UF13_9FUNG|nr:hypothetical protein DSO57_1013318 [Entomophthora muscae]
MVPTKGEVSLLVTHFTTTFSGPLPPSIQEPTLPDLTVPPIEEDIANPPIVPTVLNLRNGPCLVAYPLGTPAVFLAFDVLEINIYSASFGEYSFRSFILGNNQVE